MNRITTLLLFLLVGGLAYAILQQTERETDNPPLANEKLFEGVDASRLSKLRIEHIANSQVIMLERNADGKWLITDPISYRAASPILEKIYQIVRGAQARALPDQDQEVANAEFSQQLQSTLDVYETLSDGSERRTRVEVGEPDLDGVRLYIRKDGRVLRTVRSLETILERPLHEYRSQRIFDLNPTRISGFRRSGVLVGTPGVSDLNMAAHQDGLGWWLDEPAPGRLDPSGMSNWVGSLAASRISHFADDDPEDLAIYGLNHPQVRLIFEDYSGRKQAASFSQGTEQGNWFCKRDDLPFVWQVAPEVIPRLGIDFEMLRDEAFVRILRSDIQEVRLTGSVHEILLTYQRTGRTRQDGHWNLAWRELAQEGSSLCSSIKADKATVEDVLGTIEHARVSYLRELKKEQAFPADAPVRSIMVMSEQGALQGGRIGEATLSEEATPGATYKRDKEAYVSWVPENLAQILDLTPGVLRSRFIWELEELQVRGMKLELNGQERIFRRSHAGEWTYPDSKFDATQELVGILDAVMWLRASSYVETAELAELHDVLTLTIAKPPSELSVAIGLTAEGEAQAQFGDQRAVLKPDLYEKLVAIVGRKAKAQEGDEPPAVDR